MTDSAENLEPVEAEEEESEFGDGDDGGESVMFDGETYFYGGKGEFCEQFGAVLLTKDEGVTLVGVAGEGLVSLHDFLRRQRKGAAQLSCVN